MGREIERIVNVDTKIPYVRHTGEREVFQYIHLIAPFWSDSQKSAFFNGEAETHLVAPKREVVQDILKALRVRTVIYHLNKFDVVGIYEKNQLCL